MYTLFIFTTDFSFMCKKVLFFRFWKEFTSNQLPDSYFLSNYLSLTLSEPEERETTRRQARPSLMNSVSNLQSSNPSPDEIVIKGRGRRSLPLKWSPIPIESPQKTPSSSLARKSPKKGLIALRSSPRKRLQLNDSLSNDLAHSRKVRKRFYTPKITLGVRKHLTVPLRETIFHNFGSWRTADKEKKEE